MSGPPPGGAALPRIALVTPCLNMAPWIEETLASVHDQGYPGLEHVVVDGGSTDGTLAILERWRPRLAALLVGPDRGLYDAVNKGFAVTTGEVMTYLGADDVLLPGALRTAGRIFATFPQVEWTTGLVQCRLAGEGHVLPGTNVRGFGPRAFLRGEGLPGGAWPARSFLQAEGTFWRRSLWERAGGRMSTEHGLAGDFELWARFFRHGRVVGVGALMGAFRQRPGQLSASRARYIQDCLSALATHGGRTPRGLRALLLRVSMGRSFVAHILRHLLKANERVTRVRWDEGRAALELREQTL